LVVAGPIAEIAERLAAQRAPVGADGKRILPAPQAPFTPFQPADPLGAGVPRLEVETAGGVAVPASARRRLRLRVIGDSSVVVPLLAGGGGVLGVEAGPGGQLTVHYVGDERFVAEVVRHLVSRGVGIVGVEPERNELERIFLEVTRGDLQ
jgi:ABC-2 type transport system ATP-binding protein